MSEHDERVEESDVEEEEEAPPQGQPLSGLEGAGITAADIKKLTEGGFHTIESVAYATKRTLMAVKVRFKSPKSLNSSSIQITLLPQRMRCCLFVHELASSFQA